MRAHLCLWLVVAAACAPSAPAPAQVRPGIEVLLSDSVHLIRGRRLALLTNHTGIDRAGRRDVDRLRADGHLLKALFSPEHGFQGREDRWGLPDAVDSATGLPIYSLYAGSRPPNFASLDSVDVVLIDLQDIGARYYTYITTAVVLMREAARRGRRVVVLDRPNPLGGELVQGHRRAAPAPLDVSVSVLPVPMRHGMTMGEMARLANDAYGIGADLTVVAAAGWRRSVYFDATGLPWVKPSPNMPDLESAMHYPGTCLFEGTNVSVGRGTPFAFQVLGAPWLDAKRVADAVRGVVSGVAIEDTVFTPRGPTDGKYDAVPLRAIKLRVLDRAAYDPTKLGVAVLVAIRRVHGDSLRFREGHFDRLAAGPELRTAVLAGGAAADIWRTWQGPLVEFGNARTRYLLY